MAEFKKTADPRKGEKKMTNNVGGMDRGVRIVIGIALLVLGFLHVVTGTLAIVAYVVGAVGGSALESLWALWALAVPIGVLAALIALVGRNRAT